LVLLLRWVKSLDTLKNIKKLIFIELTWLFIE